MLKVNNKVIKINNKWLNTSSSPQPSLPPYTLRLRFTDGVTPRFSKGTCVQVSSSPNIWDLTYENTNWSGLLMGTQDLLEIIDGNSTGVLSMEHLLADNRSFISVCMLDTNSCTNMYGMFENCESLPYVPLFDTSNVTDMESMFYNCQSLTNIPLFNTSKVTDMYRTFYHCYKVESGALALYQQASSQTTPPYNHNRTFSDCGRDTQTGSAELNQIPTDWGGNLHPVNFNEDD